jgi:hypothetical protein
VQTNTTSAQPKKLLDQVRDKIRFKHYSEAGRGLQPRPKRLDASTTFESLNVKNGVANPVPLRNH